MRSVWANEQNSTLACEITQQQKKTGAVEKIARCRQIEAKKPRTTFQ